MTRQGIKREKSAGLNNLTKEEMVEMLKLSICNFENPLPATFDFHSELERGRENDYETI